MNECNALVGACGLATWVVKKILSDDIHSSHQLEQTTPLLTARIEQLQKNDYYRASTILSTSHSKHSSGNGVLI